MNPAGGVAAAVFIYAKLLVAQREGYEIRMVNDVEQRVLTLDEIRCVPGIGEMSAYSVTPIVDVDGPNTTWN